MKWTQQANWSHQSHSKLILSTYLGFNSRQHLCLVQFTRIHRNRIMGDYCNYRRYSLHNGAKIIWWHKNSTPRKRNQQNSLHSILNLNIQKKEIWKGTSAKKRRKKNNNTKRWKNTQSSSPAWMVEMVGSMQSVVILMLQRRDKFVRK